MDIYAARSTYSASWGFSAYGTIIQEISDDEIGEVKVNNELWRAVSVDSSNINVGEKVSIVSFNGNKVVVSKIKNNIEKL